MAPSKSAGAGRSNASKLQLSFELVDAPKPRAFLQRPFASVSDSMLSNKTAAVVPSAPPPPSQPKVDTKPASDVIAGAMARAASQSTIHPLDTLKVRLQTNHTAAKPALSKIGQLLPPQKIAAAAANPQKVAAATAAAPKALSNAIPKIASLYRGVVGAASGAGIAIGAYFAFYGAASNLLARHTDMAPGGVAFVAGGVAAAGGSVVKVPLAVCIRSVQAGVYPNVLDAAGSICKACGPRGLFTGYLPTLLEDVPDMACKFAAYETMRSLHRSFVGGRKASATEDFAMGAVSGAFAAAATTPLDVIKTHMMCTAASRPSMLSSSRIVWQAGGAKQFFKGVGPRALSNGINSAVFFCFFEMLRASFQRRQDLLRARALAQVAAQKGRILIGKPASRIRSEAPLQRTSAVAACSSLALPLPLYASASAPSTTTVKARTG